MARIEPGDVSAPARCGLAEAHEGLHLVRRARTTSRSQACSWRTSGSAAASSRRGSRCRRHQTGDRARREAARIAVADHAARELGGTARAGRQRCGAARRRLGGGAGAQARLQARPQAPPPRTGRRRPRRAARQRRRRAPLAQRRRGQRLPGGEVAAARETPRDGCRRVHSASASCAGGRQRDRAVPGAGREARRLSSRARRRRAAPSRATARPRQVARGAAAQPPACAAASSTDLTPSPGTRSSCSRGGAVHVDRERRRDAAAPRRAWGRSSRSSMPPVAAGHDLLAASKP